MILCLRQWCRPKIRLHVNGWGDCTTCKPNEDNKKCAGYVPVTVVEVEVYDDNSRVDSSVARSCLFPG